MERLFYAWVISEINACKLKRDEYYLFLASLRNLRSSLVETGDFVTTICMYAKEGIKNLQIGVEIDKFNEYGKNINSIIGEIDTVINDVNIQMESIEAKIKELESKIN